MKITTTISFLDEEEYGRGEVTSFTREVDGLDPYDMLWFFQRSMELAGLPVKQVQIITDDNKILSTDI